MLNNLQLNDEVYVISEGSPFKTNVSGIIVEGDTTRIFTYSHELNKPTFYIPSDAMVEEAYVSAQGSIATTKVALETAVQAHCDELILEIGELV